jgi:imidazoleglycerol-phosphate dehydratase
MRSAAVERSTKETSVAVRVELDGKGDHRIATGIGFLDHMLEQLARHSLIDIEIEAKGDLHIDMHHTTEDAGIGLGQALAKALGERRGIARYGEATVPMDEALASAAVDISGRPHLEWNVDFSGPRIGEMDTELFREWFRALAQNAGLTLHIKCHYGDNNHHIIECCFKAFARALRQAVALDAGQQDRIPSTKGTLQGRPQ